MSLADDLQLLLKDIRKVPLHSWVGDRRYYLGEIDRQFRRAIAVVQEIERAPEPFRKFAGAVQTADGTVELYNGYADDLLAGWRDRLKELVK